MKKKELPIFSLWADAVGRILEGAARFPRNLRPTLGHRVVERALEVLEHLVALRYSREREHLFLRANLALEQLRVLVRIAFERRLFSTGQYRELAETIDACGRMLGGWRRSLKSIDR